MREDPEQPVPAHHVPELASPLARTARGTAARRAYESERRDALFVDPLAALLAGADYVAWVKGQPADLGFWPVLRTRMIDDLPGEHLQQHDLRQIVLPGAGLDTRAYRLSWPAGTCLFELDQAELFSYKEPLLAHARAMPQCQRVPVPVNLA